MRISLAGAIHFALTILFAVQLAAQASPPRGTPIVPASSPVVDNTAPNTVNVLLLKSWGVTTVWEDLKTNWSKYGTRPLSIDDSTYIASDFTYQDLVNARANVLVLSDPTGGQKTYSTAEIAAVTKYARQGHPVVGTYAVFQCCGFDNRGLAPIFGLSSTQTYDYVSISNLFSETQPGRCLFRGISGTSWQSAGYPNSQVPTSGNWTGNLDHATAVAESDSYVGVITTYKTSQYTAVFISNFPEYYGGTDDEQLLYNASTCYVK
jgi:hypothetical protein